MGRVLTVCSHPSSFSAPFGVLSVFIHLSFFVFVLFRWLFCFWSVLCLILFILCCSSSLSFGTFLRIPSVFFCSAWFSFSFAVSLFSSVSLLSCVSFLLGVLAACLRFLFQRLFCCRCHVAAGRRVLAAISFCDTVGVLEEVLCG